MTAQIPIHVPGGAKTAEVQRALEEQRLAEAGERLLRRAEARGVRLVPRRRVDERRVIDFVI